MKTVQMYTNALVDDIVFRLFHGSIPCIQQVPRGTGKSIVVRESVRMLFYDNKPGELTTVWVDELAVAEDPLYLLWQCARTATFSLEEMRRSAEMLRSCRFSALSDEDRGTKPRKFPLGKQPTVLTHGRGQGKKKRRK